MLTYEFLNPDDHLRSDDFRTVESFLKVTGRTEIGWHYIVDLTWIYSKAKTWPDSFRVLDAGGGGGPLQFMLAEMGFAVTNIDMLLPVPARMLQTRYNATLQVLPSFAPTEYLCHLERLRNGKRISEVKTLIGNMPGIAQLRTGLYERTHDAWRERHGYVDKAIGIVRWIRGNLCAMPEIPDGTFDAVVSLSALEHIPLDRLPQALCEIRRVSKNNAAWAVTTSGTEKPHGWFHEPSKGYAFSALELTTIFGARPAPNSIEPEAILKRYKDCKYLQENIAKFYRRSGDNGMPWGDWNPGYVPVGFHR